MPEPTAGRFFSAEFAAAYDAAAMHLHPFYVQIQDLVLTAVEPCDRAPFLVVDLGGGSGMLVERLLERFHHARALVIDQSEPFLALARRRLARFGDRAICLNDRLQHRWSMQLPQAAGAIVSMSAIHHLDPQEKARLYAQCRAVLQPGGLFVNGDEVRPESDADYLAACQNWVAHREREIALGRISEAMAQAHRAWEERNIGQFGAPRASGEDCHETASAQLNALRAAGFSSAKLLWQRELWAILCAVA
jgi:SAM-dependent methyltransferase